MKIDEKLLNEIFRFSFVTENSSSYTKNNFGVTTKEQLRASLSPEATRFSNASSETQYESAIWASDGTGHASLVCRSAGCRTVTVPNEKCAARESKSITYQAQQRPSVAGSATSRELKSMFVPIHPFEQFPILGNLSSIHYIFMGECKESSLSAGLPRVHCSPFAGAQRCRSYPVQVSRILGKAHSFISKCELGERRVDFVELQQLAEIYRKDLSFFVTRK